MERRRQRRYPKRIVVHFVVAGNATRQMGYTTNISPTGMFVSANHIPPQGAKITVELANRDATITVEGEVVRQRVVPPQLRAVQQAGFGLRFLGDARAVAALLPADAASAFEVVPDAATPVTTAPPSAATAPVPVPVAPQGSSGIELPASHEGTLLKMTLSGPIAVAELLRRELRFGAIYVPGADAQLGRGAPVTVEVTLGGKQARLVGRVAAMVAGGITVALADLTAATDALRSLAP